MSDKARQYTPATQKKLFALSGNQCASPTCDNSVVAGDNHKITSKIAHIEAASINGPRFNPNMTDEERRHYNNLILLCGSCHDVIDDKENEHRYSVSLLREWKISHESKHLEKLKENPSLLKKAINAIADTTFEDCEDSNSPEVDAFGIQDKIEYNNIVRNRYLIDEYKVYYTKIAVIYSELEIQGSFKKENLLRNIRKIYLKIKGQYTSCNGNEIESIRENADNIIEQIEEQLLASCQTYTTILEEDISFGILIVMVDAFMRCKILEAPKGIV